MDKQKRFILLRADARMHPSEMAEILILWYSTYYIFTKQKTNPKGDLKNE